MILHDLLTSRQLNSAVTRATKLSDHSWFFILKWITSAVTFSFVHIKYFQFVFVYGVFGQIW